MANGKRFGEWKGLLAADFIGMGAYEGGWEEEERGDNVSQQSYKCKANIVEVGGRGNVPSMSS